MELPQSRPARNDPWPGPCLVKFSVFHRHSTTSLGSLFLVLSHPHSKKSHFKRNFMCFTFALCLLSCHWMLHLNFLPSGIYTHWGPWSLLQLRSCSSHVPMAKMLQHIPGVHQCREGPAVHLCTLVRTDDTSAALLHACTTCHVPIKRLKPQRY